MVSIGVFSDSDGDLTAFDAALKFLASKGARRFLFAGGKFADLDEWVKWKREEVKAQSDYSGEDFLVELRVKGLFAFGESSVPLLYKGTLVETLRFARPGLAVTAAGEGGFVAREGSAANDCNRADADRSGRGDRQDRRSGSARISALHRLAV